MHQVTVAFLNDAYVPGVGNRNLYVNYVKCDGGDRGADFPNGAYWEMTYRLTAAGRDNSPYGTELTAFFTWSNSGQLGASTS